MAATVNGRRGNLVVEGGYLHLVALAMEKSVVPASAAPLAVVKAEDIKRRWRAEFQVHPTEQDRLTSAYHAGMSQPLCSRVVYFGVADGRDPCADAYSIIKEPGEWTNGWQIEIQDSL